MKYINALLVMAALGLLVGFGITIETMLSNKYEKPPNFEPATPPKISDAVVYSPTHWKKSVAFVETYWRCIQDKDGLVLIEVMYPSQHEPGDTYNVYQNGAGYGEYETLSFAIAHAVEMQPACKSTSIPER